MDRNEQMQQLIREYKNTQAPPQAYEAIRKAVDKGRRKAAARRWIKRCGLSVMAVAAVIGMALFIYHGLQDTGLKEKPKPSEGLSMAVEAGSGTDDTGDTDHGHTDKNNLSDRALNGRFAGVVTGESSQAQEEMYYMDPLLDLYEETVGESVWIEGIDYEILTDTPSWFSVVIYPVHAEYSGNRLYYTINKVTDERIVLSDLFEEGADYPGRIAAELELTVDEYEEWIENPRFYMNENDEIIIVIGGTAEDGSATIREEKLSIN